jgi:hypothetical protein
MTDYNSFLRKDFDESLEPFDLPNYEVLKKLVFKGLSLILGDVSIIDLFNLFSYMT